MARATDDTRNARLAMPKFELELTDGGFHQARGDTLQVTFAADRVDIRYLLQVTDMRTDEAEEIAQP
jgi:hypothetical protein